MIAIIETSLEKLECGKYTILWNAYSNCAEDEKGYIIYGEPSKVELFIK